MTLKARPEERAYDYRQVLTSPNVSETSRTRMRGSLSPESAKYNFAISTETRNKIRMLTSLHLEIRHLLLSTVPDWSRAFSTSI